MVSEVFFWLQAGIKINNSEIKLIARIVFFIALLLFAIFMFLQYEIPYRIHVNQEKHCCEKPN
ncbi:MAG: hypothetical protein ABRQ37_24755, partial [Candidatus Eremiobacterota bacterium]